MNTTMLLTELGARLGLEGLHFNEEGLCRLVFDENLTIDIEQEGDHFMELYSSLCPLPADRREALYELLLAANLLGKGEAGVTFAIDPDSKEVLLQTRFYTQNADLQRFIEVLEAFVNETERWKVNVIRLLSAPTNSSDERPKHDSMVRV